jgi:hypothetical protein
MRHVTNGLRVFVDATRAARGSAQGFTQELFCQRLSQSKLRRTPSDAIS